MPDRYFLLAKYGAPHFSIQRKRDVYQHWHEPILSIFFWHMVVLDIINDAHMIVATKTSERSVISSNIVNRWEHTVANLSTLLHNGGDRQRQEAREHLISVWMANAINVIVSFHQCKHSNCVCRLEYNISCCCLSHLLRLQHAITSDPISTIHIAT